MTVGPAPAGRACHRLRGAVAPARPVTRAGGKNSATGALPQRQEPTRRRVGPVSPEGSCLRAAFLARARTRRPDSPSPTQSPVSRSSRSASSSQASDARPPRRGPPAPANLHAREDDDDFREPLILVHGINSDGAWQDRLRGVFDPHFRCVFVRYSHYRWIFGSQVAFEPWVWMLGVPAAVVIGYVVGLWRGALAMGAVAALAHFSTPVRRAAALALFKGKIARYTRPGERPSLIAHSFGTFLTGQLLKRHPGVRLENVVLTGTVLAEDYDWRELLDRDPPGVRHVRNEVGLKDPVPVVARFGRRTIPGVGGAGRGGFNLLDGVVHVTDAEYGACRDCVEGQPAPIHNVVFPEGTHGSWDDGGTHARSFWLPFLWGIGPHEYEDFMKFCRDANRAHRSGLDADRVAAEQRLLERHWGWLEGPSLEEHLVALIEPRLPRGRGRRKRARARARDVTRALWETVIHADRAATAHQAAYEAAAKAPDDAAVVAAARDDERRRCAMALNPRMALAEAMVAIFGRTP